MAFPSFPSPFSVRSVLPCRRLPRRVLQSGIMIAALALSACGSANTTYYSLSPVPGADIKADSSGGLAGMPGLSVIEVRTPSIAQTYDRDMIVLGSQNHKLNIESGASWSEPIGEMVGHVLAANLAQRLPGRVVFSQNDSVAAVPEAIIELSLSRFGIDETGHGKIDAVLSVRRMSKLQPGITSVPFKWVSTQPVAGGTSAFVSTMSAGVAALAEQAITMLPAGQVY